MITKQDIEEKAKELSKDQYVVFTYWAQKQWSSEGDMEPVDEEISIKQKCYAVAMELAEWMLAHKNEL